MDDASLPAHLPRGLTACLWIGLCTAAWSQTPERPAIPDGFHVLRGQHIELVTDLPIDASLQELPSVFDAAMPLWREAFDVQSVRTRDWHVRAYLMLDRKRFVDAGLLPDHLPDFPYGFQFGNSVWVTEQPSPYYRRHLLLHEGTHWFMNRLYGANGPPWIMEGMAELLATHEWSGGKLTMGIIPRDKTTVPYWGRITLIRDQLSDSIAPSLESILRYGDTAHRQVEAYAWSWAAVLFLKSHPETADTFAALLRQPMRSDQSLNRWLFRRLARAWPRTRQHWNAFLGDLDYGFDPSRGLLQISAEPQRLSEKTEMVLAADRSWQPSGVYVQQGQRFRIAAEGRFTVRMEEEPWPSLPQGVTLEYHQGQPLGRLLMTTAVPIDTEPDFSQPPPVIPVGDGGEFTASRTGELHFRVNEPVGELSDNEGQIRITLEP